MTNTPLCESGALPTTITRPDDNPVCNLPAAPPATKKSPQLRDADLAALVIARRFALTVDHARVVAFHAGLGATGAD
jgi:hypothetical protein